MPLHIKDEVRNRGGAASCARPKADIDREAVRLACEEALERDDRARSVVDRLADIHERMRRAARTGEKADKAFFDREWGAGRVTETLMVETSALVAVHSGGTGLAAIRRTHCRRDRFHDLFQRFEAALA